MYGLEYALFFGVPDNKLELGHGRSRWAFPFENREAGEAHFLDWLATFRRWKQIEGTALIRKSAERWTTEMNGICMELFPRPIDIRLPIAWEAFEAFTDTFNRRDFWPGQPAGLETGWDSVFDAGDIRMNLWALFRGLCDRHGGKHGARSDIALSDTAGVAPNAYYYRKGRKNIMIERDYFCAAPDLIAEVMCAPARWLNRGPRMDVYRRARVPNFWIVEPANETIELYELHSEYELHGQFKAGDAFSHPLFPGERIAVDELFRTQSKRWEKEEAGEEAPEPIPQWILPANFKVGLEYFFLLGHPERRWEFWGNRARSVLAFGSADEASARMHHFVAEACCWESMPPVKAARISADGEQAEAGRFQLYVSIVATPFCRDPLDLLRIMKVHRDDTPRIPMTRTLITHLRHGPIVPD